MEDNKMYINIVDGDAYDFTYIVKEYEIIEKHYTPTITSKQLMQWVREYAEACTGRSQLVFATGHQHIVVHCNTDVLCDFDKCKFLYIDVKEKDNEVILHFSISETDLDSI